MQLISFSRGNEVWRSASSGSQSMFHHDAPCCSRQVGGSLQQPFFMVYCNEYGRPTNKPQRHTFPFYCDSWRPAIKNGLWSSQWFFLKERTCPDPLCRVCQENDKSYGLQRYQLNATFSHHRAKGPFYFLLRHGLKIIVKKIIAFALKNIIFHMIRQWTLQKYL